MRGVTRLLLCGLWLASALMGLMGAPLRAAPPDNETRICQDLRLDYTVKSGAGEARDLNFFLFDAASRGCLHLAGELIERGASIEARNRFGNNALLIAAGAGHEDLVEFFMARGSKIDFRNLAGNTALVKAAIANERKTVKLLLKAGADPNAVNVKGITPLIAASFNGNARLVKLLLAAGADPAALDSTAKGALVYAAGRGYGTIVTRLLDAGIDLDRRHGHDLTALMWAAGHSNDVPAAEGLAVVRLLVERGAALDLADDRGRTALMIAAERSHAAVVGYLLAQGADPTQRDKAGKSARELASDERVRQALGN